MLRAKEINLIASENHLSPHVRKALSSDLAGRYHTERYGGSKFARENYITNIKKVFILETALPSPVIRAGKNLGVVLRLDKRIHVRIDRNDDSLTLKELLEKIREIQSQNPDLEVFFDGDEYAICSRARIKSFSNEKDIK